MKNKIIAVFLVMLVILSLGSAIAETEKINKLKFTEPADYITKKNEDNSFVYTFIVGNDICSMVIVSEKIDSDVSLDTMAEFYLISNGFNDYSPVELISIDKKLDYKAYLHFNENIIFSTAFISYKKDLYVIQSMVSISDGDLQDLFTKAYMNLELFINDCKFN